MTGHQWKRAGASRREERVAENAPADVRPNDDDSQSAPSTDSSGCRRDRPGSGSAGTRVAQPTGRFGRAPANRVCGQ